MRPDKAIMLAAKINESTRKNLSEFIEHVELKSLQVPLLTDTAGLQRGILRLIVSEMESSTLRQNRIPIDGGLAGGPK
jgi:hypothetical protein